MDIKMYCSPVGMAFLEEVEGAHRFVYPDSGGEPTIGIGHLLTRSENTSGKIVIRNGMGVSIVKVEDGLTDMQMYDLLRMDIARAENSINQKVQSSLFNKVYLEQFQFDALVSFVFNVGVTAFCNSTLLKRINAGRFVDVPFEMRRWKHVKGKVVQGLINRREKELQLWSNTWTIVY